MVLRWRIHARAGGLRWWVHLRARTADGLCRKRESQDNAGKKSNAGEAYVKSPHYLDARRPTVLSKKRFREALEMALAPSYHQHRNLGSGLGPGLRRHLANRRPLVAVQLAPVEAARVLHIGLKCLEFGRTGRG